MAECRNQNDKLLVSFGGVCNDVAQPQLFAGSQHGETALAGFRYDVRHPDVRVVEHQYAVNKAIHLQDADGHKAVEPSVGHLFIHRLQSMLLDSLVQGNPLVVKRFFQLLPTE